MHEHSITVIRRALVAAVALCGQPCERGNSDSRLEDTPIDAGQPFSNHIKTRQTNEMQSRVSIPDGYTIIVRGLTSRNDSYEIDSIPWLERIPLVKDLASLQQNSWRQTSLFVFLKPVILREDKFKDLRYLSDLDLKESGEKSNFPATRPVLIGQFSVVIPSTLTIR